MPVYKWKSHNKIHFGEELLQQYISHSDTSAAFFSCSSQDSLQQLG